MGLFTSLSILLVGLTWRASSAVLAKTLHVIAEACFLVFPMLCIRICDRCSSSADSLHRSLVRPPFDSTIEFASLCGIVLDSSNYLAYAWYGMTQPDNEDLWTTIHGCVARIVSSHICRCSTMEHERRNPTDFASQE